MKRTLILICFIATVALARHSHLSDVLKSPSATVKLYRNFKNSEHLQFSKQEDQFRFRIFKENARMIAAQNEKDDEQAEFGLNFFSTMTAEEKQSWLGLNITGHKPSLASSPSPTVAVPAEKFWTAEGKVTNVKDQAGCGSCWTYGAVGALESRYASVAGSVLRNFAEQEYLDCVYESEQNRDGCQGGWPNDCDDYSQKNGGRLAAMADYPYREQDGPCLAASKRDAMVSAKIIGTEFVGHTEADNIAALATGSVAVAFEVTTLFHQYTGGIMKDTTCHGPPNHAVTAVGYNPSYVLVKNSWGAGWGHFGFVKYARNHHNCQLWKWSSYPRLKVTGQTDSNPDAAVAYDPDAVIPTESADCVDTMDSCGDYAKKGYCAHDWFWKEYCRKTCEKCQQDGCPSGTVRCPDGVCKHQHMC